MIANNWKSYIAKIEQNVDTKLNMLKKDHSFSKQRFLLGAEQSFYVSLSGRNPLSSTLPSDMKHG